MKLLYLLFTPCGESSAGRTKRVIQYFATIAVASDKKKDQAPGKIQVCFKKKNIYIYKYIRDGREESIT